MKVNLALGSGAARGFAHIGVLKILEKKGITVRSISGSSMGALVAAHYATFHDVKELERIACSLRRRDYFRLLDTNSLSRSLIKGKGVYRFLKNIFGDVTFRHAHIPLYIAATSLETGKSVYQRSGKIIDALVPSFSIPGIFPAVSTGGQTLADGGLSDATPLTPLKKYRADAFVGVDVYGLHSKKKVGSSMTTVLERSYEIVMANMSHYSKQTYGKCTVIIKPTIPDHLHATDFHKAAEFIAAGEKAARKALNELK